VTPGRLALHEDALVGVSVRGALDIGSFDARRSFIGVPTGSSEIDLEEDLVGTFRLFRRAQLTAVVPFVETWRKVPGLAAFGGGFGDVRLGGRYDVTLAGDSLFPGVAILAGTTLPTGVPPESADDDLLVDTTGAGLFDMSLGLGLEQSFGAWLVGATGTSTWHASRTASGVTEQRGLGFSATAVLAYTLPRSMNALGLVATYQAELAAHRDGAAIAGGGRASTRVGLSGGFTLTDTLRLQSQIFTDLPIRWLGQNQPASTGLSILFARTWS
jgi:hypothetical protein